MKTIIYHIAAIVLLTSVFATMFQFAYPGEPSNAGLMMLFAFTAILIDGVVVFAYQRMATRK
jgi:hypothetical protein